MNTILNLDTFDDLHSILEDEFHDILSQFIHDTPLALNKLYRAISESDFKTIFAISHSLHGSTGNLGISHLSDLLMQLEHTSKSENIDQCIQFGKDIEIAFEKSKEVILNKMDEL